jgi:hypothetical protein
MEIVKSDRKDKRLKAIFTNGKNIHFGLKGGLTYIDHGDKNKRDAYIKRHQVNENFNDAYTAGALSRWLLWGPYTDINKNIKYYKNKFKI